MAKAIGFGGVFLKARDPKALAKWYEENLGIPNSPGGLMFGAPGDGSEPGITTFAYFPAGYEVFWRRAAGGNAELSRGRP